MKILITGGAGFIGTHLSKKLLSEGHKVICVDNLISGTRRNLAEFTDNKNFEFIDHDIIEPIKLDVDQVYHLACPASPRFYLEHPIRTAKTNFLGTLNALGIAKRCNAPFLLASSAEVYGETRGSGGGEDYSGSVDQLSIDACYREGKRIAETLTVDYQRKHGVNTKIVRIFNTYGTNMRADDGRAISNFIVQALLGQDIEIYGDGETRRTFLYIDDLIEGLMSMMSVKEINCGPVNIGSSEEFSINETVRKIIGLLPECKSVVHHRHDKKRLYEAAQLLPDISRAKKLLSWSPKVAFDEGVRKTIEYFKQYFSSTR